jgi:hypothetical protein
MEHGWDMPRGLQDPSLRHPLTFSRAEWQQAMRAGLDARELKAVFRQCWDTSDNRAALDQVLRERGFWLAKGDRRGFVAVDYRGEVYSLSRFAGVKAKEIEARLGDARTLRTVQEVKAEIAGGMTAKLQAFIKDVERDDFELVHSRRNQEGPNYCVSANIAAENSQNFDFRPENLYKYIYIYYEK